MSTPAGLISPKIVNSHALALWLNCMDEQGWKEA